MNDRLEQRLTWVLVAALLVSLIGVVYISFTPQQRTDPYTELYIVGSEGNASEYPQNLSVGESGEVTVGIGNHEHRTMQYTLVYRFGNESIGNQTVSVESGDSWEDTLSFTPESTGRKRLRIAVYRGDDVPSQSDPYRSVYLWVSVNGTASSALAPPVVGLPERNRGVAGPDAPLLSYASKRTGDATDPPERAGAIADHLASHFFIYEY
jgi:uncharacterized membrane protein